MATPERALTDAPQRFSVHLLDVGRRKYGDCILCRFGDVTVLIDGGHPGDESRSGGYDSIPFQIGQLLGQSRPYKIDLLIVTHTHSDHVGCLPVLIDRNILDVQWALLADPDLGFGRATDDTRDMSALPETVRRLAAALREESHADDSDEDLERFLADADTTEADYDRMIETLRGRGTRVVLYHGPDEDVRRVEEEFRSIGLRVLGPTEEQLLVCAARIDESMQDFIDSLQDTFARDAASDELGLYRELASQAAVDALADDGSGRDGAAVNDQSMVVRLKIGSRNLLFTGDMQFVSPGVTGLSEMVRNLRRDVFDDGPYELVKISHHGSSNAFNETDLRGYGAEYLGITTGVASSQHPSRRVLRVLGDAENITWARTDRNGLVSFLFGPDGVEVQHRRGELNTQEFNGDAAGPSRPAALPPAPAPAPGVTVSRQESGPGGVVEVQARIPHVRTRVTITVDVDPDPDGAAGSPSPSPETPHPKPPKPPSAPGPSVRPSESLPPLRIASGRSVESLLFVTSAEALAANIGPSEASHLLRALRDAGATVFDGLPPHPRQSSDLAPRVRAELGRTGSRGVVLLGGYDVIPPQRLDTLPADLREEIDRTPDRGKDRFDNFIAWSDEVYGSLDDEGLADVPVSRIPDGRSWQLVFTAIQAPAAAMPRQRGGVFNINRPFAREIFDLLPGDGELVSSEPATHDQEPPLDLAAARLYLMLHGSLSDASRFWGETDVQPKGEDVEVINLASLSSHAGSVVLSGCCWGALCADTLASEARAGAPLGARTPENSLALSFLLAGAIAFVGCTGAHYSPAIAPYRTAGGPMHSAFWHRLSREGLPPAEALFQARNDYLVGTLAEDAFRRSSARNRAIGFKTLRQFTCLGLGW
jgi:beta-lactamase superfamily II metal-dependent hydrolase